MIKEVPTRLLAVLLAGILVLSTGCLNDSGVTQTSTEQSNESTSLQTGETVSSSQSASMPTRSVSSTTETPSIEVPEEANATTSTATEVSSVVTVTFIVSVPDYTPENGPVYIAGDFNGWNPGDENYRLKKREDGKWEIMLEFERRTKIEFKFTRGSWETVEKGRNGEEISNRVLVLEESGVYEFTVYHWRDYVEEVGVGTHTIVGNVTTFKMFMPQLNRTRRIWVYLPPDYEKSNKRYPVLYMHDGQNLFDQPTSFAGEWKVDETLERLFREKNFSIIVVGIDNGGEKRTDEYSPWRNEAYGGGGEGDAYVRFIVETVSSCTYFCFKH